MLPNSPIQAQECNINGKRDVADGMYVDMTEEAAHPPHKDQCEERHSSHPINQMVIPNNDHGNKHMNGGQNTSSDRHMNGGYLGNKREGLIINTLILCNYT